MSLLTRLTHSVVRSCATAQHGRQFIELARPIIARCFLGVRPRGLLLTLSPSLVLSRSSIRFATTMAVCLPCYAVKPDNIIILEHPSDFYQRLKDEIGLATSRITIAALYLGSDTLERELVQCLSTRLSNNSDVNLTVLLDHARGTRGAVNSCTLLQNLVDEFDERTHIALYHTPHLRGLLKSYLPGKFSETVGLSHIKVFVFDDTVVMSGANLSESYFTNRQDRYIVIKDSPDLAEFFHEFIDTIGSFSMELRPDGEIEPHKECPAHPYYGDAQTFLQVARSRVMTFIQSKLDENSNIHLNSMTASEIEEGISLTYLTKPMDGVYDTYVYPLIQMGPLDIRFDEFALNALFKNSELDSCVYLASGYFNLTDEYADKIVNESRAKYFILTASPSVNGFYGARGVAGSVPDVYTRVSQQFCDKLEQTQTTNRIKLYEYYRDDWTFHVKGLWFYSAGSELPSMTMIGSPNFGFRSVYRDLEAQVAIVTRNADLMKRLHEEKGRVYQRSVEVNRETFNQPDRRVSLWVKLGTRYLKSFF